MAASGLHKCSRCDSINTSRATRATLLQQCTASYGTWAQHMLSAHVCRAAASPAEAQQPTRQPTSSTSAQRLPGRQQQAAVKHAGQQQQQSTSKSKPSISQPSQERRRSPRQPRDLQQEIAQAWASADKAMSAAETATPTTPLVAVPAPRAAAAVAAWASSEQTAWSLLDSQQLTSNLTLAGDWQTLQAILNAQHTIHLNYIHVTACWTRLAHLLAADSSPGNVLSQPGASVPAAGSTTPAAFSPDGTNLLESKGPQFMQLLSQLEQLATQQVDSMRPREASCVLWAAACMGHVLPMPLFRSLLEVLLRQQALMIHMDTALALWASCKLIDATGLRSATQLDSPDVLEQAGLDMDGPDAEQQHRVSAAPQREEREEQLELLKQVQQQEGEQCMSSSLGSTLADSQQPRLQQLHMSVGANVLSPRPVRSQATKAAAQVQQAVPEQGQPEEQAAANVQPQLLQEQQTYPQDQGQLREQQAQHNRRRKWHAHGSSQHQKHSSGTASNDLPTAMQQPGDHMPVGDPDSQRVLQLVRQLSHVALLQMHEMPLRCFVITLYALAMQHELLLGEKQREAVMAQLEVQTQQLGPHDLASCLSSVSLMGCRPPELWMKRTMLQVLQQLPAFKLEELTLFMHACAVLKFKPGDALLLGVCRQAARRLTTGSLRHIAVFTWACAALHWKPPDEFLEVLVNEVIERRQHLHAHAVSVLLHGLATLEYIPEPPVMSALLEHIEHVLLDEPLNSQQMATICWALPRLTPDVGPSLREVLPQLLMQHLHWMPDQCLARMLWCLARVAIAPPQHEWMEAVVAAFVKRLPTMGPTELPMCLWSLAKLGYHHSSSLFKPALMSLVWARTTTLMPVLHLRGLVSILHATAWLDFAPEMHQLQLFADTVSTHSASMTTRNLQGIESVLRTMRQRRLDIRSRAVTRKAVQKTLKLPKDKVAQPALKPIRMSRKGERRQWRRVGWVFQTQLSDMPDVTLNVRGSLQTRQSQ